MATESSPVYSSYCYLIVLNLFTFGIELCSSASFSYLPPMLLETGFSETMMSIIMALGPLFALFILPCMGTASDQCTSKYGRRRPFILAVTLCLAVSLVLLPNGMDIGKRLSGLLPSRSSGLVIIAFSVILLDFGSQISLMPIESLMSDQYKSEVELNKAYSVFNFMLSLGSCFGYLVLCIDWRQSYLCELLGGMDHLLFAILLLFLVLCTVPTLLYAHDPPIAGQSVKASASTPAQLNHEDLDNAKLHANSNQIVSLPDKNSLDDRQDSPCILSMGGPSIRLKMPAVVTLGTPVAVARSNLLVRSAYQCLNIPLTLVCSCVYCLVPKTYKVYMTDTIRSVKTMPPILRKLCMVDLLTSMAVMGFKLFFTDYVGEALYHGNPDSPLNSLSRQTYEYGLRMASLGLLLQSITSALFSFFLNHIILTYGAVPTFLFGMLSFAVMTGLMITVDNVFLTLLLAAFTGFACATINSLPFTLLSLYHQNQEVYYGDMDPQDIRLHGIGSDIALLDSAYVLSEVLSSLLFGIAVELTGTTLSYMFCCCVCSILGCYYILQLKSF